MGYLVVLFISAAVGFGMAWWVFTRRRTGEQQVQQAQFSQLSRDVLRVMGEEFLGLAKRELALERERATGDFDKRRQAVDHAIKGLEDKLHRYEKLMKDFESDRERQFGRLEGELQRVVQQTDQLHRTTANLVAVLGNSRIRGQWGQKMADDILRFCGLQEGLNYRREKELLAGRPDYTFLLPDDHQLFMDVKFPLENYLKFIEAQKSEDDQRRYREAFTKDVREHLKEMERRDYLAQSDRTVDYLLIFIPNEQVYGLVNEWMPTLIDDCLQKKVILCGPWTLYAVVRIISQAWQNYQLSMAIRDIVKAINGFMQDYSKFKERFGELGDLIQKTAEKYQDITSKSYQRLDVKIRRIEEYRKGQQIPEALPDPEGLSVEQLSSLGVKP